MITDLTGKRALVCGSTQGIGRAAAIELALLGASITLFARNEEKLKELAGHLPSDDTESHHYLVADFNDPAAVKKQVGAYLSNHSVDILVNNSGGPAPGPVAEAKTEDFLLGFSLPNFHFHVTTAYDLLRSQGVPLTKADYLNGPRKA